MYIFQILSYFFKKVGDQEAIKEFIDQLFKIPKALRNLLGIVILLGVIYFSYSKIYTNELDQYLIQGYIKGPSQKSIDNSLKAKQGKQYKTTNGMHWYTNGVDNVLIDDNKIEFYKNIGYYKGRNNYR